MNYSRVLLALSGLFALSSSVVSALSLPAQSSLTLAWDPSPTADTAGYRLYLGTASQSYTSIVDVGLANSATLSTLVPGVTYFITATAYDLAGLESGRCNELRYTASSPVAQLQLSRSSGSSMSISGIGPVNASYEVLATPDFITWTVIGKVVADSTGRFQFAPPIGAERQRFFCVRQIP